MIFDRVKEYVRASLWVTPTLFAVAALVVAQVAIRFDSALGRDGIFFAFPGSADSARSVLSTIATAMISFTGIVFTITIVALQLASQQFSPRILRTFFEDQKSQFSLSVFVATFVFALISLRQISADTNPVPRLTVTLSLVLVVASMIVFVGYLDHMAKSIRISYIIVELGDETRKVIDSFLPATSSSENGRLQWDGEADHVRAAVPGILNEIHLRQLVALARERDVRIHVLPSLGDFVPQGGKLAAVHGGTVEHADVRRYIDLGRERSMDQDVAFGFRQLVDIAVKAISPAINDPTTAVQSLDQLHDLLRRLARRPLPRTRVVDGVVAFHGPTWDGLVNLAVNEIRHFGEGYIQIARRLRAALLDLLQHSPEERHPVLERELELLEASIERGFPDAADRALASQRDEQGIG